MNWEDGNRIEKRREQGLGGKWPGKVEASTSHRESREGPQSPHTGSAALWGWEPMEPWKQGSGGLTPRGSACPRPLSRTPWRQRVSLDWMGKNTGPECKRGSWKTGLLSHTHLLRDRCVLSAEQGASCPERTLGKCSRGL